MYINIKEYWSPAEIFTDPPGTMSLSEIKAAFM